LKDLRPGRRYACARYSRQNNGVMKLPIYMDNHATTRVDPRVVEAMLPYFSEKFGNAASATHAFGEDAREAVEASRERIAAAVGAKAAEIVFTSGATESNNLAICGAAERLSTQGKHIVSVATEHPSVLEPLEKLARSGFEITLLPVIAPGDRRAGLAEVETLAKALRKDTVLVSVMLANSEIGAIQPLAEIGGLCCERGVLVHTDATQAVGKIPLSVEQLQVDLMSFTAHKIYGPKGVGALYVRHGPGQARLAPLIVGGGQEWGMRSGTLNVPGIVGFARAMELCLQEMPDEHIRVGQLRDRLYQGLTSALDGVRLNGPALAPRELRLAGNLNVSFERVDGETLLVSMKDELAVSSASACTAAQHQPSHVLRALGLDEEAARSSIRFGLGRFNTDEEVDFAVGLIAETAKRLRGMIA
jgi:cysteine desulfurase